MKNLSTVGVDTLARIFELSDGTIVRFQIYDTCGQEKYNAINEHYYKKANAILLVYDITNKKSFDTLKEYYCEKIKDLCQVDIPILLLGNKTDKEDQRVIPIEDGVAFALSNNYKFKETSCLKNENVSDAFEALIEMWNVDNQRQISELTLKNYKNRSRRNNCCK